MSTARWSSRPLRGFRRLRSPTSSCWSGRCPRRQEMPRQHSKGPPPGRGRPGSSPRAPRGAGSKTSLRGGIEAEGGPSAYCNGGYGPETAPDHHWLARRRGLHPRAAGVQGVPVEERLHITLPPWIDGSGVSIRLDIGTAILRTTPDDARRAAAEKHLASLPDSAIWVWCDGSAEEEVAAEGKGVLIDPPSGDSTELRDAARKECSSTRTMLVAIACLWKKCVNARKSCL